MCDGPVEADDLVCCHRSPTFCKGGNWEGVWKGEGRSRRRFEKDLVGDAGVFVFVAATLADILGGDLVSKWVIGFVAWAGSWSKVDRPLFGEYIAGWGGQHPGGAVCQIIHGYTNTFGSHR